MEKIAIVIACYLIGSIPFSYLVSSWLGKKDIRHHGSGNVGATNVLRTMGLKHALLSAFGDVFKGVAAAWLGVFLGGGIWLLLCSMAAILGHCYPIYLKFQGGKGVATSAGALGYLMPIVLGVILAVFVVAVLIWRKVSLGSILAVGLAPLVAIFAYPDEKYLLILTLLVAYLVVFRHLANVKRLLNGTEPEIGEKVI